MQKKGSNAATQIASDKSTKERKSGEMKLPREFRKSFMEDFDKRFFIILLISLVVHIVCVEYLMEHLQKRDTTDYLSELQQKFASLMVENEPIIIPKPEPVIPIESSMLPSGTPITASTAGTGGATASPELPIVPGPLATALPEARGPTAEDVASSVGGGGAARAEAMELMEASVGNVGLLAIITSGTGVVGDVNMNDVIAYAETSDRELQETLSNYDALKVSRGPGGLEGTGRDPSGQRATRGQQRDNYDLSMTELVGDVPLLGEAQVTEISREERFEELVTTYDKPPDVPTTPEQKERLRRKPEVVQAVIQRHNLAITDCYKSQSKLQPGLRGKVEVRFAIDADGRVIDAEVVESTFEDPVIEQCIITRIRRWNDFGYGDPTAPPEIYRQVYTFGF